MTELQHRKFTFPDGCSVSEVVVRETNGIDEHQAALAADMAGERSSLFTELLRLAIVSVNGERVEQPFQGIERWNSRTRALIMKAFEQLNELPDEMVTTFLELSEPVEPPGGVTALRGGEKEATG